MTENQNYFPGPPKAIRDFCVNHKNDISLLDFANHSSSMNRTETPDMKAQLKANIEKLLYVKNEDYS